jgi:Lipopolysaccharide-assembly
MCAVIRWPRSTQSSGIARTSVIAVVCATTLTGCFWKYGFHGGGLPANIKSIAVLPFENNTPTPELQKNLLDGLRSATGSRLGLREASEDHADAVLKGTIQRYDIDVPVGYSGGRITTATAATATTTSRRLELQVDIEIDEQSTGRVLWQRKGLVEAGDYPEGGELQGRTEAVKKVVNDVIEGAQSQW